MFDFLGLKKGTKSSKILVVDDEPNIIQAIQDRLEKKDYTVCTAANGKEGLEAALSQKPDLILLDVMMPLMDGHEMLEALRKHPDGRNCMVIMLTARSQNEDIVRSNACNVNSYIVKPFDLGELLEKIEEVLTQNHLPAK